jgi:hypothetical protein
MTNKTEVEKIRERMALGRRINLRDVFRPLRDEIGMLPYQDNFDFDETHEDYDLEAIELWARLAADLAAMLARKEGPK